MAYKSRRSMGKKESRRKFTKTAKKVHPKNGARPIVMRGGIRF